MEIIIKLDHDEPVKVNTASIYGEQHPLPDWDPEKLRDEIQDLKLENDRLKQRVSMMYDFTRSIACDQVICDNCKLYRPKEFPRLGANCAFLQGPEGLEYIRAEASKLLKRLEEL